MIPLIDFFLVLSCLPALLLLFVAIVSIVVWQVKRREQQRIERERCARARRRYAEGRRQREIERAQEIDNARRAYQRQLERAGHMPASDTSKRDKR
jgi:uncharacterized protein HemX